MPKAKDPNRPILPASKKQKRLFTNRINETTRFLELLNAPIDSPLPLLMFYGVGGAGKTTLIRHLQEKCDEMKLSWVKVDLAEAQGADDALPRLVTQFEQRHGFRFKGFKQVLAVLVAKETNGVVIPKVVENLSTSSHIAGIALEGLGLVPVIGQIALALKLGKDALQLSLKKALKDNEAFRKAVAKIGGEKELFKLACRDEPELRDELLRRFAAELASSLPEGNGKSGRGVLFFDQHEVLWRDERGGAFSQDAWIRLLREYLHGRGVLMVVSGRDHLRWPEDWLEEDDKGRRIWLEEHLVGGLSRADALELLHRADVEDWPAEEFRMPQELQSAILRVTDEKSGAGGPGSHHCYLLTLCAGIVANTKAETGKYPDPAIFDQIPEGEDTYELIVTRFLTSLHNQAMVLWLQELSLTPRFDEDYALSLDAHRRHNNGRAGWERLRQLSLLEGRQGGFWEMHKLLRGALRKRVEADAAKAIHVWSKKYWYEKAAEDDWKGKGIAWYHYRFEDHSAAIAQFLKIKRDAEHHARAQTVRHLTEWWSDVDLTFEPKNNEQAKDLFVYANALRNLTTGNITENLRYAITCYEASLRFNTEIDFPVRWANTQENLGAAYIDLPTGNLSENLHKAIACFEAAGRVYSKTDYPKNWAGNQMDLGRAYLDLQTESKIENLQRAIACFETALSVYTETDYPVNWASTQHNLGLAYSRLPFRNKNLRDAIACFEAALRVKTETDYPVSWASTQNSIGLVYRRLRTGNRIENLHHAMACFEATLQVFTETDFPNCWAMIQNNMGLVYSDLITEGQSDNPRSAIACFEAALSIYTETDYPAEWARLHGNLGDTYLNLTTGDRNENLHKAIAYFEAALSVFTETAFPVSWAAINESLGYVYSELTAGSRNKNLHKAIAYFETALTVYTKTDFPFYWANIQTFLGNVYGDLTNGDRTENLRREIAYYKAALGVYTKTEFPDEWATTYKNLGIAYSNLTTGDHSKNMCYALDCFEAALEVFTKADYPKDWAFIQSAIIKCYR